MSYREPKQPYRFEIINEDGSITTGGGETKGLTIDHLYHCLKCSLHDEKMKNPKATKPGIRCFYLGSGDSLRKEITL